MNTTIPEQDIHPTEHKSWLEEESKQLTQPTGIDRLPTLKFEEQKQVDITVDFSKPFVKWNGTDKKGSPIVKAIIPVMHNNEKKNWWLNTRNPTYRQIIQAGQQGQIGFKIIQVGNRENTQYVILK